MEQDLLQMPDELRGSPLAQSELDCLNLSITCPPRHPDSPSLPVLVFVHGGALRVGSSFWPQSDPARLVALSASVGKPCIVVSIAYRLGVFGFLASSKAGLRGNYGFDDQAIAFDWIRRHISGFGGDPARVTAAGQSAGALSVHRLAVHSDRPLFSRLLLFGGTEALLRSLTLQEQDAVYDTVISAVGGEENLHKLPAADLLARLPPMLMFGGTLPADQSTTPPTFRSPTPAQPWLEAAAIGSCPLDAHVFARPLPAHPHPAASFVSLVRARLSPTASVDKLIAHYGIDPSLPKDRTHIALCRLASDVAFNVPARIVADALFDGQKPTFRFSFAQGNPFPGPYAGQATHILDLLYFFQNYNQALPPADRKVAERLATQLLAFVSGEEPWGRNDNVVMRFGPEGDVQQLPRTDEPDAAGLKLIEEIGVDECWAVFRAFFTGEET
jgi:carboxylesterase type B